MLPGCPLAPQRGSLGVLGSPKELLWASLGCQIRINIAPFCLSGSLGGSQGRFLIDFGTILGTIWGRFGKLFGVIFGLVVVGVGVVFQHVFIGRGWFGGRFSIVFFVVLSRVGVAMSVACGC